MRPIADKEYCHNRLGADFAHHLSNYDTQRRVEVLIDDFLPDEVVRGKEVLDVGCGLGWFSARLRERGAVVTACDLGPAMVEETRRRTGCHGVVADALELVATFGAERFDVVVSSECIEHTPDPPAAIHQMAQVLRPGGWLALSTPNLWWYPCVRLATLMKLRPFDGYENFSTWNRLRSAYRDSGLQIAREQGVHLYPFQFKLHPLSRWLDRHAQWARGLMINLCLLGQKNAERSASP